MQSSVSFLTLEIYVIWVSNFLQDELHIEVNALIASQHQRSHFLPIELLQISPALKQDTQILAIGREGRIMDWFPMQAVLNIHDIREDLEQLPQELRVGADGGSVDGRAVVVALVVLDEAELLELVDERHAADEQVVVLVGKV